MGRVGMETFSWGAELPESAFFLFPRGGVIDGADATFISLTALFEECIELYQGGWLLFGMALEGPRYVLIPWYDQPEWDPFCD
ncbi:predicted protein [Pyrenophora tritici-repentis Pt-1C-BFP]|uniref:Uncharacterized protein n=1 Tax=Pyrenophora tritici-repentis (strain Pt-1C-BFP) TaxID=426418 RepID=B2WN18_PYRTR|nr:uncharacterized protein PTRG_11467 [Pyrenophora tritici-repentis Pt-1C-BFP]EDU44517.1 predicted protein [Pyrenophora tritici-repentis Pt-1C-BFP]